MAVPNPLIIYRNWFITIPLKLADQLAIDLFNVLSMDTILKGSPGIDLNAVEARSSDTPGINLLKLMHLIDELIINNKKHANYQFSLVLCAITHYFVLGLEQSKLLDAYKTNYIESIALGNTDQAKYFEQQFEKIGLNLNNIEGLKLDWQLACSSGFSFQAIHSYLINS